MLASVEGVSGSGGRQCRGLLRVLRSALRASHTRDGVMTTVDELVSDTVGHPQLCSVPVLIGTAGWCVGLVIRLLYAVFTSSRCTGGQATSCSK